MRSFAQEGYEISRYSAKVDDTLELGLKQAVSSLVLNKSLSIHRHMHTCIHTNHLCILLQKMVGLFSGGMNAASTLSVIIVVIYGANLTITGSMTPGALTSFILYSLTGKSPQMPLEI